MVDEIRRYDKDPSSLVLVSLRKQTYTTIYDESIGSDVPRVNHRLDVYKRGRSRYIRDLILVYFAYCVYCSHLLDAAIFSCNYKTTTGHSPASKPSLPCLICMHGKHCYCTRTSTLRPIKSPLKLIDLIRFVQITIFGLFFAS